MKKIGYLIQRIIPRLGLRTISRWQNYNGETTETGCKEDLVSFFGRYATVHAKMISIYNIVGMRTSVCCGEERTPGKYVVCGILRP